MPKEVDFVIFGASGFTGKHCISFIHKFSKADGNNFSWAVAGRSEEKLKDVLKEYEQKLETSFEKVPLIIADVKDEESLVKMAAKARLIINCCGPFRFYGEPVVKACIQEGTHHIDVSGEPQYMEGLQLKYFKEAQEKGIYIVSACGFDSIPTDLGVIFLQQKFGGTLNTVETYLKGWAEGESEKGPGGAINYGTWESAVYGLAHGDELRELRRELYPERLPSFKPKLQAKAMPHKVDVVDGWVLPFLGSDKSVVKRSQRFLYEKNKIRPVQIETYFVLSSFIYVVAVAFFGMIFGILTKFSFGRSLLLKYPELFSMGFFSKQPPQEATIEKARFSVTIVGKGWKDRQAEPEDEFTTPMDKEVIVLVKGTNPGYGATCLCLVLAGITVLTEKPKLPSGGGVYPPGAAFANTSLIERLNQNGLTFEVLSEKDL